MPDPARVVFVVSNYPPRPGGAERHTQRLCRQLCERGNLIQVLTIRYPESHVDGQSGEAPVWHFPTPSPVRLRDLCFAMWVVGALVWLRPRFRQVQWVMTGLQVVLGMPVATVLGMKNILMLSGSGHGERLQHTARGRWLLRWLKRHADRIIILNSEMRVELQALGFEDERLTMLGCEANPERFHPATEEERKRLHTRWKIAPDIVVITYVGRLIGGKGLLTLVDAYAMLADRHPETILIMAGDGPLRSQLSAEISYRKLGSRILLTGQLHETQVSEVLRLSDIFTLPSESEGIPAALVEAMASGLPSVVSNIPGTEIVVEGVHGLRCPCGDARALAAALDDLIFDPIRRQAMGHAARELFLSEFTPDKVAQSYERMYEDLAENPHGSGQGLRRARDKSHKIAL